ncbi:MAG: sulfotransferase domain-containing protein [Legionellales bacterium]|nr:sulfotransferase domain-containing protein [Legionellales bacterium]
MNVYYIIILRNPLDVAKSLHKRDGFSYEYAALLWLKYNISIVEYTKDKKYLWVTYESMMNDTKKEISSIATFLGLSNVLDSNQSKFLQYKETFLEKSLHHNRSDLYSLKSSALPDFIIKAYLLLLKIYKKEFQLNSDSFIKEWENIKESNYAYLSSTTSKREDHSD